MSLEERHEEEGQRSRRPRDHGGRDRRDATASHRWQPATGGRKRHGRTGGAARPAPRRRTPGILLHSYCPQPPSAGPCATAATGNGYGGERQGGGLRPRRGRCRWSSRHEALGLVEQEQEPGPPARRPAAAVAVPSALGAERGARLGPSEQPTQPDVFSMGNKRPCALRVETQSCVNI